MKYNNLLTKYFLCDIIRLLTTIKIRRNFMEVSRLTFREETIKQLKKGLSKQDKGRILQENLVKLEESGQIAFCKNRKQLAEAAGYTREEAKKRGASWASKYIVGGVISETLRGFDKNNVPEYEYHYLGGTVKKPEIKTAQVGMVQPAIQETKTEELRAGGMIKIEIMKGDITIRVEFVDQEHATTLITSLLAK